MKTVIIAASLLACVLLEAGCGEPQWTEEQPATPPASAKPAFPASATTYHNAQYSFCFALPLNWKGYTVANQQWRGVILSTGHVVNGPEFVIRNPLWTESDRFQDIPIMVFTPAQWKQVDNVEMSVSAAPMGPSKLGQTSRYVFALPPRWIGFTDAVGSSDVQAWMQKNRLHAPCEVVKPKPQAPAKPAPQQAKNQPED
jgi:hypothetical protein